MKLNSSVKRVRCRCRAFTLLEILLVLAVIVVASSVALPSFHRAFIGQQLRSAADVVRARFSESRVQAMQSGDVVGFFYTPGGDEFFIAPMVQGFRSIQNGTRPTSRQGQLENNILFAAGETSQDGRSDAANESANTDQPVLNLRPVLFYPDGTSQDAVVVLQSPKNGRMIQIELRGLTGLSSKSRLLLPNEVQQ